MQHFIHGYFSKYNSNIQNSSSFKTMNQIRKLKKNLSLFLPFISLQPNTINSINMIEVIIK